MKKRFSPLIFTATLCLLSIAAQAQQAVILVRHAEFEGATTAATMTVAPKPTPLSDTGKVRAENLAKMLKNADVGAVYVTDFVRTHKTGEPLARSLHKEVIVRPKEDPKELVEHLQKNHASQTVVLVGHTDTIPALIKALGSPTDLKIEHHDYSNIFVVVPKKDAPATLVRLQY
jgi:broad specificity phosphatase PhoE